MMKRTILALLSVHLFLVTQARVIEGTVLDRETHETIPFAAVYFSGSFKGTICDMDGSFQLDISGGSFQPVTISAVGYYSFTLDKMAGEGAQTVFLVPKLYEIPEVAVSTKSLERRRKLNMKIFRTEFLGTSSNARHCQILNEGDITFNYGSDGDTLKAYAMEPIQIRNSALGYRITYYPDQFEYDKRTRTTLFVGDIFFERTGYYDPKAILWRGAMGIQRVGDFLPYIYDVER